MISLCNVHVHHQHRMTRWAIADLNQSMMMRRRMNRNQSVDDDWNIRYRQEAMNSSFEKRFFMLRRNCFSPLQMNDLLDYFRSKLFVVAHFR